MGADAKTAVAAVVVVLLLPLLLLGWLMLTLIPGGVDRAQADTGACGVNIRIDGGGSELDGNQRSNAKTIIEVGKRKQIPQRGWIVALAAAHQESRLVNVSYGDRDSVGLFQQRSSWGAEGSRMNPEIAAAKFYNALRSTNGWQQMQIGQAAQAVQKSAYPTAYDDDVELARSLVAQAAGTKICADTAGGAPAVSGGPQQMLPNGLIPRADKIRKLVNRRFDPQSIGGFCPGGCTSGHVEGSDHYTGKAVDVMVKLSSPKGDRIAGYLAANQQRLQIKYLIWDGRIRTFDGRGWRAYTHPSGNTSDPTLMHRDHVHISVK